MPTSVHPFDVAQVLQPARRALVAQERGRKSCSCLALLERPFPMKPAESGVVRIGGDPLAAVFDRQRREPGVLDQIARYVGRLAEVRKDGPMTVAGLNQRRVRGFEQRVTEGEGLGERGRLSVDLGRIQIRTTPARTCGETQSALGPSTTACSHARVSACRAESRLKA